MTRKYFTTAVLIIFTLLPLQAQQTPLKREVTLYNPYKPSLNQAGKISYMPDLTDTAKFRPQFSYDVTATPFMPAYTVSPIKPAALQPDPLNKLYRSYVNIGFGNYTSPLAEISITSERSKKGALGFYGRHYSNNGNVKLENDQRMFAGYMDNELSLFGKKFFKGVVAGASVDYNQMSRHAYGYNPEILNYHPGKKITRRNYGDIGANISVSSTSLDSSRFAFDFNVGYDHFYDNNGFSRNRLVFEGEMAKSFRGFFVGSGLDFKQYNIPHLLLRYRPNYIAAISPFVKKSTNQWNFKLGIQALLEKQFDESKLHVYPDLGFGFNIVPSYLNFFTSLTGRLEVNDVLKVIEENPFLLHGHEYVTPNTDHKMVALAGFRGNNGLDGSYELSVSYSLTEDMLFYSNLFNAVDTINGMGNYFTVLGDEVDLLKIHAGWNGRIAKMITLGTSVNLYKYTMTNLSIPSNKPEWDATVGLKYNLRDKIIAGMDISVIGDRKQLVLDGLPPALFTTIKRDPYLNLNISAEYRYSKILSFWAKMNNLSYQRYYEWAYYPGQRFLFMLGFTYSL